MYLILVTAFLVITFITKDVIYSDAFACLGIITGVLAFKNLSTQQQTK